MRIKLPIHSKMMLLLMPAIFIVFSVAIVDIFVHARANSLELTRQLANESAEKYVWTIKAEIASKNITDVDAISTYLQDFISDIDVYGNGHAFIISSNGTIAAYPDRSEVGNDFNSLFTDIDNKYNVLENIAEGNRVTFDGVDFIDSKVSFLIYTPININKTEMPWCLVMSVPYDVIKQKAQSVLIRLLVISIIGILLLGLLISSIAKRITIPLRRATGVLDKLSKGEIHNNKKLHIKTGDVIEDISVHINSLLDGLNKTVDFANTIGSGNLKADYQRVGDNDELGSALIDMRHSLVVAEEEDDNRKKEDDKQTWASEGIAVFSDILRNHNLSVEDLSFNIMSKMVDYTGAIQGGLFVKNSNDEDGLYFEITGSIAYDRRKTEKSRFRVGESLVGRCAYEKLTIYMEEVPLDYVHVTSGLGESNPQSLLLVPAILNDEVFAVIELVSFNKIEAHQIEFVEKIGESIASTIANSIINDRTKSLLEQSKIQSEELAAQEEEMRQNLEELQATQEEVGRLREEEQEKNKVYIEQVDKYKLTLAKILDLIPLKVFLKDSEGRLLMLNQMVLDTHHENRGDLIGKNDLDLIQDKHEANIVWSAEQEVIKSNKSSSYIHEETINNTGVILDTTKHSFYIDYLDETGLLGIQQDVTELTNKEEMISQLQDEISNLKKE